MTHRAWWKGRVPVAIASVLAAVVVAVLSVVNILGSSRVISELFNFGHVVFFGLVAVVALRLSKRGLATRFDDPLVHYAISLAAVAFIGVAIEAAQYYSPRDADLADVVRDLVGGVVGLAIVMSYDGPALGRLGRLGGRPRLLRAFGALLLVAGMLPLLLYATATAYREAEFPKIASFESVWESWFYRVEDGAEVEIVEAADVDPSWGSGRVARVVFEGASFPGISFFEPVADWRGYREVVFSVFSPESRSVELQARIHDFQHNDTYRDRFNGTWEVQPGPNEIHIALDDVEHGPYDRLMDMASIDAIALFMANVTEPVTLYIDDVELR